jgi:WD40 repeat protein
VFILDFRYDHKMYLVSIFENKIADLWDIANMFSKPAESPTIQKLKAEDHFDADARMLTPEVCPRSPRSPIPPKIAKIYPESSVDDVMTSMVMTSEADHIITTSANSRPKVWDVMTGLLIREIKATAPVKDIKPCVIDTALVGIQELVNEYGTVYVLKVRSYFLGL